MPVHRLARHWWVMALRGACALLFGIIAVIRPWEALDVLVIFYGAYMLVDGTFALVAVLTTGPHFQYWWALLIEAICGIGIGIIVFAYPIAAMMVLLFFIAFWAILTGVFEVLAALRLRQEIAGEIWLILAGIISVLFGVVILVWPDAGAALVGTLIGLYAGMFGITLLALAFRLRRWHQNLPAPGA